MILQDDFVWDACLRWLYFNDILNLSVCSRAHFSLLHKNHSTVNLYYSIHADTYVCDLPQSPFQRIIDLLRHRLCPDSSKQCVCRNPLSLQNENTAVVSPTHLHIQMSRKCLEQFREYYVYDAMKIGTSLKSLTLRADPILQCWPWRAVQTELKGYAFYLREDRQISRLDLSECREIDPWYLFHTMSRLPDLEYYRLHRNTSLQKFDLSKIMTKLVTLCLEFCGVVEVDLGSQEYLKNLTIAACCTKSITLKDLPRLENIDLRANVVLKEVEIIGNSVLNVDLGCCPALESLSMTSHSIQELDLSMLDALRSISITSHSLHTVTTFGCRSLETTKLRCPQLSLYPSRGDS